MHPQWTYHPFEAVREWLNSYFPQLPEYVMLYRDCDVTLSTPQGLVDLSDYERVQVQQWRQLSVHSKWILPHDFPWIASDDARPASQLHLLDEEAHQLLLLAFPSPVDGLKDILAIRFPKQHALFGLQKSVQALTTDEKVLLSDLLHRMCLSVWKEDEAKQRKAFQIQRFNQLKSAATFAEKQAESGYQHFFQMLCSEKAKLFFPKEVDSIVFQEDALACIARLAQNEDQLDLLIRESITLLLAITPTEPLRSLQEIHVMSVMESLPSTAPKPASGMDDNRYIETLDRYEQAAARAQQLGLPISGKNVAACLKPAISPPAITDFLRKYQVKIQQLLADNPSRWKLIRNHLKPLREIDAPEFKSAVNG